MNLIRIFGVACHLSSSEIRWEATYPDFKSQMVWHLIKLSQRSIRPWHARDKGRTGKQKATKHLQKFVDNVTLIMHSSLFCCSHRGRQWSEGLSQMAEAWTKFEQSQLVRSNRISVFTCKQYDVTWCAGLHVGSGDQLPSYSAFFIYSNIMQTFRKWLYQS